MLTFWLKEKFKKQKRKSIKNINILQYVSEVFLHLWVNWFIKELPFHYNSFFTLGKSPGKSSLRVLLLKFAFLKYITFSLSYYPSNQTLENSVLLWPIATTWPLHLHILSCFFSVDQRQMWSSPYPHDCVHESIWGAFSSACPAAFTKDVSQ